MTAFLEQEFTLRFFLDTLSDDLEIKALAQRDGRPDYCLVIRVPGHVPDKGLVDLQPRQRKLLEIYQR